MGKNEVVLEASTNTHVMKGKDIVAKDLGNGNMDITAQNAIVTHGEHGTISVESGRILKVVQQELNPVTKKMQNAFD